MYAAFKQWNEGFVARPGLEMGFDGVDWDLEGNDDVSSPFNEFTVPVLDLVGRFSQLAQADGYIVSLVPPESYLDPMLPQYNRSLLLAYDDGWQPQFKYHGRNCYAYMLAKYGATPLPGGTTAPTFDLVMIQLYESYSHADYNVTAAPVRQTVAAYLEAWVPRVLAGWVVEFASDPPSGLPTQAVNVSASQLVVGLANGWAGGAKSILMMPEDVGEAHAALQSRGLAPRGYVFWTIAEEGDVPPGGSSPLYFAAGVNSFLHTRPS